MAADQGYLQVEGVNIYASVFDTNQLSVVRGSSFLLREAIHEVGKKFSGDMQALSVGASSGVFQLLDTCLDTPDDLEIRVAAYLNDHRDFGHLTFIVVSAKADDFAFAREQLMAQLRVRQLRSPTLAPDILPVGGGKRRPCALEGRRVGAVNDSGLHKYSTNERDKSQLYSPSVVTRWNVGRERRKKYYEKETDNHLDISTLRADLSFTDDLQTLAECAEFPQLNNKLAVLYVDGNGFGKIQRDCAKDESTQRKFDQQIRECRSKCLASLIQRMDANEGAEFPRSRTERHQQLRFETLLWGGDEALFVAPAWHGFDLLHAFYQHAASWHEGITGLDQPLTHAGGLVFCQATTPIAKIRTLAQQLADNIKDPHTSLTVAQKDARRTVDLYDYVVLESVDYASDQQLDHFRRLRYGALGDGFSPLKLAAHWRDTRAQMAEALEALPKSQVYRLAQLATRADSAETDVEDAEKRLKLLIGEAAFNKSLAALDACFSEADDAPPGKNFRRWIHLAELWDYLVPQQTGQQTQGNAA